MASFPTSLAGEVERGTEAGQFPGPGSSASPRGTPDFIDYGERGGGGDSCFFLVPPGHLTLRTDGYRRFAFLKTAASGEPAEFLNFVVLHVCHPRLIPPGFHDAALHAAREALDMSGWSARTDKDRDRAGVAIGSGIGDEGSSLVFYPVRLCSSTWLLCFPCGLLCRRVDVSSQERRCPCHRVVQV